MLTAPTALAHLLWSSSAAAVQVVRALSTSWCRLAGQACHSLQPTALQPFATSSTSTCFFPSSLSFHTFQHPNIDHLLISPATNPHFCKPSTNTRDACPTSAMSSPKSSKPRKKKKRFGADFAPLSHSSDHSIRCSPPVGHRNVQAMAQRHTMARLDDNSHAGSHQEQRGASGRHDVFPPLQNDLIPYGSAPLRRGSEPRNLHQTA